MAVTRALRASTRSRSPATPAAFRWIDTTSATAHASTTPALADVADDHLLAVPPAEEQGAERHQPVGAAQAASRSRATPPAVGS